MTVTVRQNGLAQSALCLQLAGAIVGDVYVRVSSRVTIDVLIALNLFDEYGRRVPAEAPLKGDALELSVWQRILQVRGVSCGALRHWEEGSGHFKAQAKTLGACSFVFGAILRGTLMGPSMKYS